MAPPASLGLANNATALADLLAAATQTTGQPAKARVTVDLGRHFRSIELEDLDHVAWCVVWRALRCARLALPFALVRPCQELTEFLAETTGKTRTCTRTPRTPPPSSPACSRRAASTTRARAPRRRRPSACDCVTSRAPSRARARKATRFSRIAARFCRASSLRGWYCDDCGYSEFGPQFQDYYGHSTGLYGSDSEMGDSICDETNNVRRARARARAR